MEFKTAQLDNGLTIVAEHNPAAQSMACGFFVRTGSRDETPEVNGVSHFLEHMMFKGTERRTPLDVNREFDEMGASYNAFTSEEYTVYYGAVLPDYQQRLLDLLCDIIRPSLRPEDFDTEKGVILEEIAMYEDMPKFRVFEKLLQQHFAPHPLGNLILGTADSIRNLKRDDMMDYFRRRYSPGNMTLVGVGNLDFDAFVAKADAMCGAWEPCDAPRELPEAAGRGDTRILHDRKVAREHIGMLCPAPSAQHEDRYAAYLAASVLGDPTGSRLYYALVDPGLADEAGCGYDPFDHAGALFTFISADTGNAPKVLEIAREEFRKFAAEGPTEEELQAAKNKTASSVTLKGELPMGRLTAVGFDWLYRREYVPLASEIEHVFAVTRGDVLRTVREFDITALTTLALGPLESL